MAETETATPPTPPKSAGREAPPLARFAIELGDSCNRVFFWHPNQATYRGRWAWANIGSDQMPSEDPIRNAPDLPGLLIIIDPARKKVMVHDAMNDERNEPLLDAWQKMLTASPSQGGQRQGPAKEMELTGLPDDTLKTWAYWARRLYDAEQCVVRLGKMPAYKEVMAMPGDIYGELSDPRRLAGGKRKYRAPDAAYQPPKVATKPLGEVSLIPAELE